jgi:hypothetical protein
MYWTIARERKPKKKGRKWLWVKVDAPEGRAIALFTTPEKATIGGEWITAQIDQQHAQLRRRQHVSWRRGKVSRSAMCS